MTLASVVFEYTQQSLPSLDDVANGEGHLWKMIVEDPPPMSSDQE